MVRNVTRIENKKEETRKRVAAYCRVSTDADAQKDSLENQMKAFRLRIAQHKDWDLVKIYADEGISGTSMKNRTQFLEMIEDCKAGLIDYVISKSISRFARNTVDTLTTVRELQSHGVQVIFDKEGIDTSDSLSEMVLSIMASFAQEESRSISENVKWGIRKRFEEGKEMKVPLYGFCHTDEKLFQIKVEEARIVKEIFERYVHGELPMSIMNDMIARGVKPPAGDSWKRLQLDRMLKNEKYAGDSLLQKTYVENYLNHRQVKNSEDVLPMFYVQNAHSAIVDRHIFDQAQKITEMRKICNGNSTYPYGDMLKCPRCGKTLVHGNLSNFTFQGERIYNGGWGCYGEGGCGNFLLIQNFLDAALIEAYADKYDEEKGSVEYYWLDDFVEGIELALDEVGIYWRDRDTSIVELTVSDARFRPTAFAAYYNGFLARIASGEQKNKYKRLMGLGMVSGKVGTAKRMRPRRTK